MEDRTLLSTFFVSNSGDDGAGSLRQAIINSNDAGGPSNTISFAIPGSGVQTIAPLSPLPAITEPVLIDGESQPGYSGAPLVEINGSQAGGGDGLLITAPDVAVRGLDIDSFSAGAGIHLTGAGATGDWIYGDFLGTDPTGTQAEPNDAGIEIDEGAASNLIGTNGDGIDDAAERNLLSGNLFAGAWINGQRTNENLVAGNFIGTDITGSVALNNGTQPVSDSLGNVFGGGVAISAGAAGNRVGTDGGSVDDTSECNVIAGSTNDAIDIWGTGTDANVVAGNFIGTDVTGTRSLGIARDGVYLAEGASSNWVGVNPNGGTAVGDEGNVISGNGNDGVQIDVASNDNVVAGNTIGADVAGSVAVGNSVNGVEIDSSVDDAIGGTTVEAANVISGNGQGVVITGQGSSANLVAGNDVGTNRTDTTAIPNNGPGVLVAAGASNNTIGGSTAAAGNLITDNAGPGVVVGNSAGDTTVGDMVTANRIFANTGQAIDLGDDGVTGNSATPRQGPNNLQNFPVIVSIATGQLEASLGGSAPDTSFQIDVFASAAYGPGGAGEAQDDLGSLEATTDAYGQVSFAIPFAAPAGLPIITATATDPNGNTSEVSVVRQGVLNVPTQTIRAAPGQAVRFSAASGHAITLQDPGAGPFDPAWEMTISVTAGTLILSTTASVAGTGDGTGSLTYSGPLSALNAALEGMTFAPPPGYQGYPTLSLNAQSEGTAPIQAQVRIVVTSGQFEVTTIADSGPGSLRQAILDSNVATGGTNTIDFVIPGSGVQTIALGSPLPSITNPLIIDASSQPGYTGIPLIAVADGAAGDADPLTVGSDVTVRGLAIGGSSFSIASASTMLTVESVPLSQAQGGIVTYQLVVPAGEDLVATAQAAGMTVSLSLLDAEGHVVMQSDGLSAAAPIDAIDTYLVPGAYALQVSETSGAGSFMLTIMLTPSAAPFQTLPVGLNPQAIVAGDFNGDGHLDLAISNSSSNDVSVLLGNGDGTFQPQVTYAVGAGPLAIVAADFNGDGKLDLALTDNNGMAILLGNGDGTFQPASMVAAGLDGALVAGDFSGDGRIDLAVSNYGSIAISVLLGNGDGTFRPAVSYTVGSDPAGIVAADFNGDGKLDLALTDDNGVAILLGNGDGTFQPASTVATGLEGGLAAGDFNGDSRIDLAVDNSSFGGDGGVSVLLGNGDGTFQPQVSYAVGQFPSSIVAGDFSGDGRTDLVVANAFSNDVSVLLGNGNGPSNPQSITRLEALHWGS